MRVTPKKNHPWKNTKSGFKRPAFGIYLPKAKSKRVPEYSGRRSLETGVL